MPRFPRLSVATKFYAIFALLATAPVVLALAPVAAQRFGAPVDEYGLLSLLGGTAILLGAIAALVLRRNVVHPLVEIARLTEQVAEGKTVAIPYGARGDELGSLSRSIGVFQN